MLYAVVQTQAHDANSQLRCYEIVMGILYEGTGFDPALSIVWHSLANARRLMFKTVGLQAQTAACIKPRYQLERQYLEAANAQEVEVARGGGPTGKPFRFVRACARFGWQVVFDLESSWRRFSLLVFPTKHSLFLCSVITFT